MITIETKLARRLDVFGRGFYVEDTESGERIAVALTADERRALVAVLDPERERDAAVARADAAERECDEMRTAYDESVSMAYWAAKRLGCHVDDMDDLTLTEMAERVAAQPAPAVSRAEIEKAVRSAFRAWGYNPDTGLEKEVLARISPLLANAAEAVVDPVEAKAQELWEVARFEDSDEWSGLLQVERDCYRRMAAHVLGQEADR